MFAIICALCVCLFVLCALISRTVIDVKIILAIVYFYNKVKLWYKQCTR